MAGYSIRDGKLYYVHPKTQREISLGTKVDMVDLIELNGTAWRQGYYCWPEGNHDA